MSTPKSNQTQSQSQFMIISSKSRHHTPISIDKDGKIEIVQVLSNKSGIGYKLKVIYVGNELQLDGTHLNNVTEIWEGTGHPISNDYLFLPDTPFS